MTDITSAARGGTTALQAARFGWRILNQRRWYAYLRFQAVVRALTTASDRIASQAVHEAAVRLCESLDELLVPMEPRKGFFARMGRWFREKVTVGVRYPVHRGPAADTFFDRLYGWAKAAAETGEGTAALDHAQFPGGGDRSHAFALRVVAETWALLLDNGVPGPVNEVRDAMAAQVHRGHTRAQVVDAHKRLTAAARTITTGVASTLLTYVGFDQSVEGSLAIGGIALASSAVVEASAAGFRGVTEQMQAARRQARDWLATMTLWLMEYVTWREREIRHSGAGGVGELVGLLTALRSEEAHLSPPPENERIEQHLRHLIETASRVGDDELHTALMNVEGAVLFGPQRIPNALAALIALVEDVPDLPGPGARAPLPPGSIPPQLGTGVPGTAPGAPPDVAPAPPGNTPAAPTGSPAPGPGGQG
ncbi:hypothetical protein [Streptomyces sp. t39]|uniref:hypothetical protein n=1 Tax=Streptomyces sp. t39 TaxID=1828156 RepID=UPI0016501616|nr:hypothetical protein [Streptomyces sp. t39]